MRLLTDQQNDKTWKTLRNVLSNSDFTLVDGARDARTIPGNFEGKYALIAVKYILLLKLFKNAIRRSVSKA